MNETTCVRGTVYSASSSGQTFFINFDNSRTSFYGVAFGGLTIPNLRGACIEIRGTIVPYKGRPEIIINSASQVSFCK